MAEEKEKAKPLKEMSKDELLKERDKLLNRLTELADEKGKSKLTGEERTAYAQSLIDKMFTTWKTAGDWINQVKATGREKAVVFGPTGQPRHLYGYLHMNNSVRNAMDRRGPNSIIQGHSSGVGYTSSFCIRREYWHTFEKKGIDLGFYLINMVHDSSPHEIYYAAAPIGIYLIEHGMSTLVARHYKKVYGMETRINHLNDMQIGLSEAKLMEWPDQRFDSLLTVLEKVGKDGGFSKKQIGHCLHNTEQIAKVRIAELKTDPFKMTLERNTKWYVDNMRGIH